MFSLSPLHPFFSPIPLTIFCLPLSSSHLLPVSSPFFLLSPFSPLHFSFFLSLFSPFALFSLYSHILFLLSLIFSTSLSFVFSHYLSLPALLFSPFPPSLFPLSILVLLLSFLLIPQISQSHALQLTASVAGTATVALDMGVMVAVALTAPGRTPLVLVGTAWGTWTQTGRMNRGKEGWGLKGG